MMNPLLIPNGLPRFDRIQAQHIEPAVDELIARNRQQVAALCQLEQPSWSSLIEPLEIMGEALSRLWNPVSQLHAVADSPELRAAYQACLPKLSAYETELGQNQALYQAYQKVARQTDLQAEQQQLLKLALRDFKLSGIDLPPAQKKRFAELVSRLSELENQFENQVLDATQAWQKQIQNEQDLAGMPQMAKDLARQAAERKGLDGWLLSLDFPSYYAVISYADDRQLRQEIYTAYNTRASDQGPHAGRFDNGPIMREILALRREKAQLLGYANYAELSLASKMAESTAEVLDFLRELARRAKPQAQREYEELQDFAAQQGIKELQAWDIAYYSEKLRQARYQLSQEQLKPYFPQDRVIQGMFQVLGQLFQIRIQPSAQKVPVWHQDVLFYDIFDARSGDLLGQFYFDLYARENKRGGAWMADCLSRLHIGDQFQHPVAFMNCNFNPPLGDQPALLTHEEVQTLFHEFGHGLHHMLTEINYPSIAGIAGVPWDAVELPSQLLENWCWQKPVLDQICAHYQSGEPLPESLYQRMLRSKNFQSAMQMLRQIEFALFDFRIHLEDRAEERILDILQQVRDEVAVVQPPAWNRFSHSFNHIFAGGYAAGYYSYKWAEVLSADAFSRFEEEGILNPDIGLAFRQHILAKGGSDDAMALFIAFRGRKPSIEPLLKQSGIE